MASITTTQFAGSTSHVERPPFSLLEQPGLLSRLTLELQAAIREFRRDPRAFAENLFRADTKDAKRRRRLYIGLTLAAVIHTALLVVIAVFGWHTVFVKQVPDTPEDHVVWVPSTSPDKKLTE